MDAGSSVSLGKCMGFSTWNVRGIFGIEQIQVPVWELTL